MKGLAITIKAINDNNPYERLKRAIKSLEEAVENNRRACLEFQQTIKDLNQAVSPLGQQMHDYRRKLDDIKKGAERTGRMSRHLSDIMDTYAD